MLKHLFITTLFTVMLCSSTKAQLVEGGVLLGGSVYSGDLDPDQIGEYFGNVRPAIGLFFRYQFDERLSARLGYQFAKVLGDHADAMDPRNLNFQSRISEVSLVGEFNVLPFGFDQTRITPFVMGGIGFFHFNPYTEFEGREVELQPLGTEGQTLPDGPGAYNLNQFTWILGGGIRYALTENLTIGLESSIRITFTDFLDDVSGVYVNNDDLATQVSSVSASLADRSDVPNVPGALRGNAARNDTYYIGQISISYNFHNLNLGGGKSGKLGCPTF
ncbi:MAG: porin family protein [Saprospiraceae bacterium]|nr:porin family protein [Saprospiraceae bacterium]